MSMSTNPRPCPKK